MNQKFPVIFLIAWLIPLTALADAGTPLMWAGIIHLFVGNAIIGICEGVLLAMVFKVGMGRCILVMVVGNYVSSWGGAFFLGDIIQPRFYHSLDLYDAWLWFWIMVAVTFALTLVLEWPFVFFCLKSSEKRLSRSIYGNLLVNSISYVMLFSWYWSASGTDIYRHTNIVRSDQMKMPADGELFYISSTNGNVCSLNFRTGKTEAVFPLKSAHVDDRLCVKPADLVSNTWNIYHSASTNLVASNLNVLATQSPGDINEADNGTWFNFGEVPKLGNAERSNWSFKTGFWPIEGLQGINSKSGINVHFSLETPFIAWNIRNATHLPDDYVVFQLGEDQICIFESATRKIAMIARGRGPVVVLPK